MIPCFRQFVLFFRIHLEFIPLCVCVLQCAGGGILPGIKWSFRFQIEDNLYSRRGGEKDLHPVQKLQSFRIKTHLSPVKPISEMYSVMRFSPFYVPSASQSQKKDQYRKQGKLSSFQIAGGKIECLTGNLLCESVALCTQLLYISLYFSCGEVFCRFFFKVFNADLITAKRVQNQQKISGHERQIPLLLNLQKCVPT